MERYLWKRGWRGVLRVIRGGAGVLRVVSSVLAAHGARARASGGGVYGTCRTQKR